MVANPFVHGIGGRVVELDHARTQGRWVGLPSCENRLEPTGLLWWLRGWWHGSRAVHRGSPRASFCQWKIHLRVLRSHAKHVLRFAHYSTPETQDTIPLARFPNMVGAGDPIIVRIEVIISVCRSRVLELIKRIALIVIQSGSLRVGSIHRHIGVGVVDVPAGYGRMRPSWACMMMSSSLLRMAADKAIVRNGRARWLRVWCVGVVDVEAL